MKNIRWGIVGSGAIASRFVDDLQFVPFCCVASVWGRNSATAGALAQRSGAAVYDSLEALLQSDVDAIYIATMPDTHTGFSIRALQQGKAVLCEKPAAVSCPDLTAVLEVAKQSGMLYMEAMKPPFFPVMAAIARQMQAKPLGTIRFVQSGFSVRMPPDHSSWQASAGGGSLAHIGVYHAWLAVHWLGAARNVACAGRVTQDGVDGLAACLTTHENGGISQFYCGLEIAASAGATIAGDRGTLLLDERWWSPRHARIHYHDGETVELAEPYEGDGLHFEVAHFCDLLRSGALESPVLTQEVSRNMAALLEAARVDLLRNGMAGAAGASS